MQSLLRLIKFIGDKSDDDGDDEDYGEAGGQFSSHEGRYVAPELCCWTVPLSWFAASLTLGMGSPL